jgi:hypothetical protein
MVSQIESQLTDLFDDDGQTADKKQKSESAKSRKKQAAPPSSKSEKKERRPDNPKLQKLKEIVLSIEWEISDEGMGRLLDELEVLKTAYEKDKPVFISLQLLGSVGKYIMKDKVGAHPEAIQFLHEVFNGIESLTVDAGLKEAEKKELVRGNVAKFNALKEKISSQAKTAPRSAGVKSKAASGSKKEAGPAAPQSDAGIEDDAFEAILERMREMNPQEAFAYMLVEIKKTIREALKDRR